MTILKKAVGVVLATSTFAAVGLTAMNNGVMIGTRADDAPYLSNGNSPTLSDGSGTMVDSKGITWEYSNALDLENGHVSIKHGGYFSISSQSAWGLTGITEVKAEFAADANSELWLLTSYNGVEWNEQLILKNNEPTDMANNWKYIRFYNYSSSNNQIDINKVYIEAVCGYTNASEDIDSAHVEDVLESHESNLSAERETVDVSPRLNSIEAVRFTKIDSKKNSSVIITLGRTYVAKISHIKNLNSILKVASTMVNLLN